ncbi:hypothetical protein K2Z84_05390 [Candidatus Binatia bacterium]|nr:hypothetical protein [Candidatus Binatia bacterium]
MAAGDEKIRVTIEVDDSGLRVFDQAGKLVKQFATEAGKAGTSVDELADAFTAGLVDGLAKASAETAKLEGRLKEEQRLLEAEIELRKQVNEGVLSEIDARARLAREQAKGNEGVADLLERNSRLKSELEGLTKAGNDNTGMWQRLKSGAESVKGVFEGVFYVVEGGKAAFEVLRSAGEVAFDGLNTAARTFRESTINGIGTEYLSELTALAEASGREMDDVLDLVRDVRKRVGEASTELARGNLTNTFVDAFNRLGAGPEMLKKFATDTEAAVDFVISKIAQAKDDPRIQFTVQELTNSGFEKFGPIVAALGEKGVAEAREQVRALGLSISDETAALAQRTQASLSLIGQAFDGVIRQLTAGAAPALEGASSRLVAFATDLGIADGRLQDIGATIGAGVASSLDSLIALVERLSTAASEGRFGEQLLAELQKIGPAVEPYAREAGEKIGEFLAEGFRRGIAGMFSIDWSKLADLSGFVDPMEAYAKGISERVSGAFDVDIAPLTSSVNAASSAITQFNTATASAAAQNVEANNAFSSTREVLGQMADGSLILGKSLIQSGEAATKAGGGYRTTGGAAGQAAQDLANFNKELAKQSASLSATQAIYQQAARGTISLAQADQQAAVASATLEKGITDEKAKLAALTLERQKAAVETAKAAAAAADQVQAEQAKLDVMRQVVAAGGDTEDVARAVALADIERAAAAQLAKGANEEDVALLKQKQIALLDTVKAQQELNQVATGKEELTKLREQLAITQQRAAGTLSAVEAERRLAIAAAGTTEELRKQAGEKFDLVKQIEDTEKGYVHLGDTIKGAFTDVFDALVAGTLDLQDSLKSLGLAIGKDFFNAMLESKFKDFDPTVKANFLELGDYGKGIFGSLFDGVARIFGGGGGGGFVGPLLENGTIGTGGGVPGLLGFGGGGGLGLLANLALNSGGFFANSNPGVSLGLSGLSLANSGLSLATGSGIIGSLFGTGAASSTIGSLIGDTGSGLVTSLFGDTGSSILATSLGTAGAVGGGVVGGLGGAYAGWQLGQGGQSGAQIAASAASVIAGGAAVYASLTALVAASTSALNAIPVIGTIIYAIIVALAAIAGAITDITPTAGTLRRRAAEAALDQTATFAALQKDMGDLTRKKFALNTNPDLPQQREYIGDQGVTDLTGFATVFAQTAFGGSFAAGKDHVQGIAQQWTNILTEFFARLDGSSEEVSATIRENLLSAFRDLGINDATKAFEMLNGAAANFKLNTDTFDYFHEQIAGAESLGTAVRGVAGIFEQELPPGVHLAALALESMTRDGTRAFSDLDSAGHDSLVRLADDAKSFDALVGALFSNGFEIDTEDFDRRMKDITASAGFVSENIGELFSGASVGEGLAAFGAKLKETILGAVSEASLGDLFDNTNIAASFEPVFAVLRQLNEGAYKNDAGRLDFGAFDADMVAAIAEGKATLADYLPEIIAARDAMQEFEKAIDEALEPTPVEAFWLAMEDRLRANTEAVEGFAASLYDAAAQAEALLPGSGQEVARDQARAAISDGALGAARAAAAEGVAAGPEGERLAALQTEFQAKVKAAFEGGISTAELGDLANLKARMGEAGQALADKMSESAKVFDQLFAAERWKAQVDAVTDSLKGAIGGAGQAFFDVLKNGGSAEEAAKALGDSFRSSVQQSVVQGITDAVVQGAVIQGALAPLIAGLQGAIQATLPGGINAAESQFLSAIVGKIGTETNNVIGQLTPLFTQLGTAVGGIFENTDKTVKNIDEIDRQTRDADYGVDEMARRAARQLEEVGNAVPPATVSAVKDNLEALKDALPTEGASTDIKDGLSRLAGAFSDVQADTIATGVSDLKGALGADGGLVAAASEAGNALVGAGGLTETLGTIQGALGDLGVAGAADDASGALRDQLQVATESAADVLQDLFSARVGDAATAAERLAGRLDAIKLPGAAKGGTFGGGTVVVGEEGPEVVTALDGGGFHVEPISRAQMNMLLGNGMPGFADGGSLIPIGRRGGNGGRRPGLHPAPVDPRTTHPGSDDEEKTISVSFSFDSAIDAWMETGDPEKLRDEVRKSIGEGILEGMKQGLMAQLGLEEFQKKIAEAIDRGASAAELTAMGEEFATKVEAGITAAGPAFDAVAEAFGVDVQEKLDEIELDPVQMLYAAAALGEEVRARLGDSTKEIGEALIAAAQKAAPVVGEMVGSSLKGLLSDPDKLNFENFSQNLRGQIYQNVAGGLIDAFIQSAVIQGALAPMLGAISVIFDQIGKKQLTISEANGLIAQQIGLINGVLDDPAFKDTLETLIGGVADIGKNLNAFPPAAREVADSAVEVQDAATAAQEKVCDGECELQKEIIEYGATALNAAGRKGEITDTVYREATFVPSGDHSVAGWYDRERKLAQRRRIPAFADGGVVTQPTIALVGEAGPEAIIPLGGAAGRDDSIADAIAALSGQGTGGNDAPAGDIGSIPRAVRIANAAPSRGGATSTDVIRELIAELRALRGALAGGSANPALERLAARIGDLADRPLRANLRIGEHEFIDVIDDAFRTARQSGRQIGG